jgi:hypothetical protein
MIGRETSLTWIKDNRADERGSDLVPACFREIRGSLIVLLRSSGADVN